MSALRQRMVEEMQLRRFALRTQESYLQAVTKLVHYTGKSPACPARPGASSPALNPSGWIALADNAAGWRLGEADRALRGGQFHHGRA